MLSLFGSFSVFVQKRHDFWLGDFHQLTFWKPFPNGSKTLLECRFNWGSRRPWNDPNPAPKTSAGTRAGNGDGITKIFRLKTHVTAGQWSIIVCGEGCPVVSCQFSYSRETAPRAERRHPKLETYGQTSLHIVSTTDDLCRSLKDLHKLEELGHGHKSGAQETCHSCMQIRCASFAPQSILIPWNSWEMDIIP